MNESISSALGISKEWEENNVDKIKSMLAKNEIVSNAILQYLLSLKQDEFNIQECEITDYEKKIFWSGMEMARILINTMINIFENEFDSLEDIQE